MRSYQGNTMIKMILVMAFISIGTLQAEDIVHYDTRGTKTPSINKPNHPTTDLYTKKS